MLGRTPGGGNTPGGVWGCGWWRIWRCACHVCRAVGALRQAAGGERCIQEADFYDLPSPKVFIPYTARVMNTRGFAVRSAASRQRGFSLVEVLISIIILSFGMLGMVGMQAASLQANVEARRQSTAAVLARELAEMMRGNQTVAIQTSAGTNPYLGNYTSPLTATTPTYCLNVGAAACADTLAVANSQMTEWLARVEDALPGARVEVCFDSDPYDAAGLPKWCPSSPSGTVAVIRIGWTRGSTNRALALSPASAASALERATDSGSRPLVIFSITPGSAI